MSGPVRRRGGAEPNEDISGTTAAETALRASESLLRGQARVLELIATGASLPEVLSGTCRALEGRVVGAQGAIWLVDDSGMTMKLCVAPSMPESFVAEAALLDIADTIGAGAGERDAVMVADPVSGSNQRLAAMAGPHLAGLWWAPIRSAGDGRLLAAISVHLAEARSPTAGETAAVELLSGLAALGIERSAAERRLAHRAYHDPLTGLPNRALFSELLEHALARAQRSGTALAVLFVDLDRFKLVNDSLGHDAGDALLVTLARRLEEVLRPGDVVARFGGDEFTVLCEDLDADHATTQVTGVAQRLLGTVQEPFVITDGKHQLNGSIGVALAFTGLEEPTDLLRDADAAMYRAKEAGRGRYEIFDEEMRVRARQRSEFEHELERAVAAGQLRVYYQPVISLHDGVCVAVEALVRWQHPERGLLSPRDFLALAEATGLIVPIGQWLLGNACNDVAEWRRAAAKSPLGLAVNLSMRELGNPQLTEVITAALERAELGVDALTIEVTERALIEDADAGMGAVRALKVLGVRVSVDNFGAGYSSLGSLRRFPVDEVKIDRSFVERLGTDREDSAMVAAVANLAHVLGVSIVAEGVETPTQLAALRDLGADAAQGFLFAPPQPARDLRPMLMGPQRWW